MTRFIYLLFVAVLIGFVVLGRAGFDDGKATCDSDYATAYIRDAPPSTAAQKGSFVGKSGCTIGSATNKITSNISNTCV